MKPSTDLLVDPTQQRVECMNLKIGQWKLLKIKFKEKKEFKKMRT